MAIHLKACPSCARHARISESVCPFCGSALPASFRTPPPIGSPARRLTRAALLSLGAAAGAVGLLEACSGDDNGGGQSPGTDAGPGEAGHVISFADAYGIALDQTAQEPEGGARDQYAPDHMVSFADAYGIAFFDQYAPHEASTADQSVPDGMISFADAYGVVVFDTGPGTDQAAPDGAETDASAPDAGDAGEDGD